MKNQEEIRDLKGLNGHRYEKVLIKISKVRLIVSYRSMEYSVGQSLSWS